MESMFNSICHKFVPFYIELNMQIYILFCPKLAINYKFKFLFAAFFCFIKVVRLDTINDVIIEGDKTFTDAAFNEQLLCSKFNNVDLKDLENNAFSKVKEQDVSGKWSLENAVFTGRH